MLTAILPLLEALGAEGGHAASLGHGSGIGATLGKLLGGQQVKPFGGQQELGGAFKQISDLTSHIAQAREAMSSMRSEHETLGNKAREDERLYGFRDPGEADRMADLQQQQIAHARQMQQHQQQMESLQARAAVTMDPQLGQQEERRGWFRRAGAMAVGGQAVQSLGPSFLRNLPGVQTIANTAEFTGGPAGQIANEMGGQAAGAASNVAGAAMKGAAVAGPVGAAVAGGAAAVGEIAKLPSKIKDWSESLLASQKTISRFSGAMAQAFAQREVRGLKRDIESASVTGGSTAELSKTLEDLYDTLRPLKDTMTVQMSAVLGGLLTLVKDMVPLMQGLMDVGIALAGKAGQQLKQATEDAARQREFERKRQMRIQGGSLSRGIAGLKAEDPLKPRQPARR